LAASHGAKDTLLSRIYKKPDPSFADAGRHPTFLGLEEIASRRRFMLLSADLKGIHFFASFHKLKNNQWKDS